MTKTEDRLIIPGIPGKRIVFTHWDYPIHYLEEPIHYLEEGENMVLSEESIKVEKYLISAKSHVAFLEVLARMLIAPRHAIFILEDDNVQFREKLRGRRVTSADKLIGNFTKEEVYQVLGKYHVDSK